MRQLLARDDPRDSIGLDWKPPKFVSSACIILIYLSLSQALSDVIESVIGAIYVSDDFSPLGAEEFFENLLKPFYDKHISLKTLSHHPTKNLFELLQARGCQRFKMLKERTKTGIISCQGKLYCVEVFIGGLSTRH